MDISGESQETLDLYGVESGKPSFAYNCLLARRLVERGVRFIQLFHTDWDHHGNKGTELEQSLDRFASRRTSRRPRWCKISNTADCWTKRS